MIKKWLVSFYLVLSIILPSVAFAQSDNEGFDPTAAGSVSAFMMKTQQEFNRELIATMTKDLMDNPVVGWRSGGLVKVIFIVCFVIALAQALSNSSPTGMVTDMTKLAFWSWLVIALLGGPTYQKFSFLNTGDSRYTSSVQSLDADIFNFAAYHLDQAADSLFAAAGPQKLMQSSIKNKILTENLMNARRYCQAGPAGATCMQAFMKDDLVDPKTVTAGAKTEESKSSGSYVLPDIVVKLFEQIYLLFSDLTLLSFYFFSWVIDIIRAAMNMFILLSFGIITGTSFFLMKFIFPFAVLGSYRGKVMQAMKVPLSATMYGFATSLIVYISAVGYTAMNTAAIKVIFKNIASGNLGSLAVAVPIIQTSVFTGMLIFALLQVFAIAKIPQLCRSLLDLSFDSFVNFAKEVVSAGVGIVGTVAAAAATGGASLAMGGAGGMLGRAAGSIGGGLSAVGQKLGFSAGSGAPGALFKGGAGFSGAGGTGGSKPSPSIGGMQIGAAQDSAASPSPSTTSVAQAVTQESVLPKEVKEPNKAGSGTTSDNQDKSKQRRAEKIAVEGFSPEATEGDRKKALKELMGSIGESKKGGGAFSSMISSGLQAGLGKSGSFEDMVEGKLDSASESTVGLIQDTEQRFLDPVAYQEKQRKIAEAKAAAGITDPDGLIFGKDSSLARGVKSTQMYKSFQSNKDVASQASFQAVSGAIDKTQEVYQNTFLKPGSQRSKMIEQSVSSIQKQQMNEQQELGLQNIINNINSGVPNNSETISQMISYKSQFNMDKESTRKIDNTLDKETKLALGRIEEGKGNEEDFELAYKSQNFDYASRKTRQKVDQLMQENEEFGTYSREQSETNDKLRESIKNEKVSSRKGSQVVQEMSQRVNSGMLNRDIFRETVGEKAVEFNKEMGDKRQAIVERDISKALKAKEAQEKLLSKLKVGKDEDIKFKHNDTTYEFAENRGGNISTDVVSVNGETTDDFSVLDESFINQLKAESLDIENRIKEGTSGSPQYVQASKKRVEKMENNLKRIKQIIEAYEDDKNNKKS